MGTVVSWVLADVLVTLVFFVRAACLQFIGLPKRTLKYSFQEATQSVIENK